MIMNTYMEEMNSIITPCLLGIGVEKEVIIAEAIDIGYEGFGSFDTEKIKTENYINKILLVGQKDVRYFNNIDVGHYVASKIIPLTNNNIEKYIETEMEKLKEEYRELHPAYKDDFCKEIRFVVLNAPIGKIIDIDVLNYEDDGNIIVRHLDI